MAKKDETIQGLRDYKQALELKVNRLQIVVKKFDVEKIDGVLENPSTSSVDAYDDAYDDIACSLYNCKKDYVHGMAPSHALLATTTVIYPIFAKHTIGIRSRLLGKIDYTDSGLWKSGQGIAVPIILELRLTIAGLGYDGISSTNRGGSTSIAILFVAGGSHPTELQEEQVIADGFVESVEY